MFWQFQKHVQFFIYPSFDKWDKSTHFIFSFSIFLMFVNKQVFPIVSRETWKLFLYFCFLQICLTCQTNLNTFLVSRIFLKFQWKAKKLFDVCWNYFESDDRHTRLRTLECFLFLFQYQKKLKISTFEIAIIWQNLIINN